MLLDQTIGHPLDQCEAKCSARRSCHSFGYCPGAKRCFTYAKIVTEADPQIEHYDCFTSYKSCKNRKIILLDPVLNIIINIYNIKKYDSILRVSYSCS